MFNFRRNLFLVALLVSSIGYAQFYCTEWTQQGGWTCIFAGRDAKIFKRQCENPCGFNLEVRCDKEEVCYLEDPSFFNGGCSPWHKVSGLRCYNPSSGDLDQKWQRSCTIALREEWCSDEDPNLF